MSRRAKARRAQSAEPGERDGSVDPPAASFRENQNRGSEETLDMSSVMATDMQQGGGPRMKRAPVRTPMPGRSGVGGMSTRSMFWRRAPEYHLHLADL
jgi:hypothetical protein